MRRRTLLKLLIAVTLVGVVAPPVLSLIGFNRVENRERIHTAATMADVSLGHAEQVFESVRTSLERLAQITDGRDGDESIRAFKAFVFAQRYVRGIGIVVNGTVVATNDGRLHPPWPIPGPAQVPPAFGKLGIYPPMATPDGGRSIVAVWRVRNGVALCAAIDPLLLTEVARTLAERDHVHLEVRIPGGERLVQFGVSVPAKGAIRFEKTSNSFPLMAIAEIGRSSLMHTLAEHGWLAITPGLGLDALFITLLVCYARRASSIEADLREASAYQEVSAEYQPQWELATGACVGAEILMRWNSAARGPIPPDVFIPIAEELGLIRTLTRSLVQCATRDLGPWISTRPDLHVSINLSPEHCRSEDAVREIEALFSTGIPVRQLVYEITERGLIERAKAPGLVRLEELARENGAALALDDFGTGYSSLGCLNQFRFQYLKIDKSFVDGIRDAHTCDGTLDHVITIARSLGMTMIAEGIEHDWQVEYLRAHGVQFGQGWFFSQPLGAKAFRSFVENDPRKPG